MAPTGAPRAITGLREVAHLYRAFLFDLSGLEAAAAQPQAGARLLAGCARQLVGRGKLVAAVAGTPLRAASVAAQAQSLGFPAATAAWSSGEFLHRTLAGRPAAPGRADADFADADARARELLPFVAEGRATKVFELSSVAKPRRWSEYMARGPPPLAALEASGAVRRVDSVEEADVCYWDARDSDEVPYIEAILELCTEFRVPLLQVRRSAAALRALDTSAVRGSSDAAALDLSKFGGKPLGVSKLAGYAAGLGWSDELAPQDVLLVSSDLGDVVEAAEEGIDTLLLLGDGVSTQLQAFRSAVEQTKAAERRHMSVSQRVAEDSPAMLQAAANPLLSVFKLPGLLAEATRKNAEHRAKVEEAAAREASAAAAAASATAAAADGGMHERGQAPRKSRSAVTQTAAQRLAEEALVELLLQWSAAFKTRPPSATATPPLLWDADSAE